MVRHKCDRCDDMFQAISGLNAHIELIHGLEVCQECDRCENTFQTMTGVRKHILKEHKSFKPCREFLRYSNAYRYETKCHFSHIPIQAGKHRCYKCGIEVDAVIDLMEHRKLKHKERCRDAIEGKCRLNQNTCYLNHPPEPTPVQSTTKKQDFHLAANPPNPPGSKIPLKENSTQQVLLKIAQLMQTLLQ